jgi:hypothetical protein
MKMDTGSFRFFPDELSRWSLRKKLRHPFAGLRWFTRDSGGGLNIVSRHWPHMLCWSWLLSWHWPDRRKGEGSRWRPFVYRHNGGGWASAGPFRLHWQNYDWMISRNHAEDAAAFITRAALSPTGPDQRPGIGQDREQG